MKKTILSEVDGWTPLINGLVQRYGVITAAVFGRVWRYCQMSDQVCRASLETIGEELHLNRSTVMDAVHRLAVDGYLEDLTPGLRNHPHTFKDTGMAGIKIEINASAGIVQSNTGVVSDNTKSNGSKNKAGVVLNHTGVVLDNSGAAQNNTGVVLDPMKKEEERIKKESEERKQTAPLSLSPSFFQGRVGQPDLMQPIGLVPPAEPPAGPASDPPPGPTAEHAWESMLYEMQSSRMVSKVVQDSMIKEIKPVSLKDGLLVVQVPNEYAKIWFEERMKAWAIRQLKGICNRWDVSISVVTPEAEGISP